MRGAPLACRPRPRPKVLTNCATCSFAESMGDGSPYEVAGGGSGFHLEPRFARGVAFNTAEGWSRMPRRRLPTRLSSNASRWVRHPPFSEGVH
jgi:hypothetical protein